MEPSDKKFMVRVQVSASNREEADMISQLFDDKQTKRGNTDGFHWSESSKVLGVSEMTDAEEFLGKIEDIRKGGAHYYTSAPVTSVSVKRDRETGKMRLNILFYDGSEMTLSLNSA